MSFINSVFTRIVKSGCWIHPVYKTTMKGNAIHENIKELCGCHGEVLYSLLGC